MPSPTAPGATRDADEPKRRFVLSEDLPLTIFVGVATAVVFGLLDLGAEWSLLGVATAPLAAEFIKQYVARWSKRRLLLGTALLVFFGRVKDALARSGERRPVNRVTAETPSRAAPQAMVVTAAVASALTIAAFTAPELARGESLFGGRETTFFDFGNQDSGDDTRTVRLEVAKTGDGSGTVTSAPAGVDCGRVCSARFPRGGIVELAASADPGAIFAGWRGGNCSGTESCTPPLTGDTRVVALFRRSEQTVSLSVSKEGDGSGTVTSVPSGIVCGPVCTSSFRRGRRVELLPLASPGSVFAGWRGAACPDPSSCPVILRRDTRVIAVFRREDDPTVRLKVELSGEGRGTVLSDPAGIDCGTTCEDEFPQGEEVTLTPQNDPDSRFDGWEGGGCDGTGPCTVRLDEPTTVVARFEPSTVATETLTVGLAGNGQGTVRSTPEQISCEPGCEAPFPVDSQVTLTAEPSESSTFVAWKGGGDCDGSANLDCVITMTGPQQVVAIFSLRATLFTLSVSIIEDGGTGTVASRPPGIRCGPACSRRFRSGTMVELRATYPEGSSFVGWEGDCSDFTCVVTMDADRSVSARFQTSVD